MAYGRALLAGVQRLMYPCLNASRRGVTAVFEVLPRALPVHASVSRRARAPAVGGFICIARRARAVPSQAIVRWKAGLTVRPEVLAVRRNAPGAPRYGPVKLGLRHAVSAYRGGPWEQWARAGAAQGSIIASGTLRGSRRYRDDAQ